MCIRDSYKNGHEGFLTGIDGMISVFDYILNGKELSLSEFGTLLQKFPVPFFVSIPFLCRNSPTCFREAVFKNSL